MAVSRKRRGSMAGSRKRRGRTRYRVKSRKSKPTYRRKPIKKSRKHIRKMIRTPNSILVGGSHEIEILPEFQHMGLDKMKDLIAVYYPRWGDDDRVSSSEKGPSWDEEKGASWDEELMRKFITELKPELVGALISWSGGNMGYSRQELMSNTFEDLITHMTGLKQELVDTLENIGYSRQEIIYETFGDLIKLRDELKQELMDTLENIGYSRQELIYETFGDLIKLMYEAEGAREAGGAQEPGGARGAEGAREAGGAQEALNYAELEIMSEEFRYSSFEDMKVFIDGHGIPRPNPKLEHGKDMDLARVLMSKYMTAQKKKYADMVIKMNKYGNRQDIISKSFAELIQLADLEIRTELKQGLVDTLVNIGFSRQELISKTFEDLIKRVNKYDDKL